MTPKEIEQISYPVEQIYERMTDELLLNIAKHLNSPTWTWTALREVERLGTMGQLTEENIKIINKYVQMIPETVKSVMDDSRKVALQEIEEKLANAAANGFLTEPVTDSTVDVTKALSDQALSQLNLVNQTMLDSSLSAYQGGLYELRQGMTTITDQSQLMYSQEELDLAAAQVVEGTETRVSALRKTLKRLNANGITGFFDRAGRSWSAEAYVNMDIRTTVHNTYIQSVRARQQDYGSDVFQVSAHAGARPLCYPYQGKLYSWSQMGGHITLGDGKRYKFENISATSYGKPAGLFGINCGHVPYPMIPGVSEKVDETIPPKKENDKEYQESQEQRQLERNIRYYKRELQMLGNLATDEDKQKLRNAQADMRAFIEKTGRTRRYDREQIETASEKAPTYTKPKPKVDRQKAYEDYFEYEKAQLMKEYSRTGKMPKEDIYGNEVSQAERELLKAEAEFIQENAKNTKQNTVYRGMVLNVDDARAINVGDIYEIDSLTSTSTDKKIASIYSNPDNAYDVENGVPVIVTVQQSGGVVGFQADMTTPEVILPKGQKYRVAKNYMDKSGVVNIEIYAKKGAN